ncbi:alpha/beta fold hydrolase [Streptomyces sp. NPDC059917]|uniref:alpha/beta fold hydrolase n=1 Tax=Streptomyces sp. NPDC059917 TaxID=3347002 RepID=UPI00365203B9
MTPRLLCFYAYGSARPWDIVRAVEPIADLVVVISSDDRHAQQGRHIFETLDVPVFDTPEAARAEFGTIDGIVTYSELCVVAAADTAERWGLPGMPRRTAEALRSKLAQRERLAGAGCDDVPFLAAATADEVRSAVSRLGMPVVVKPDRGTGSRDTRKVATPADLEAAAAMVTADEQGGYIVERLLQGRDMHPFGDYVSVEVLMAAGEPVVLAVTGKLPLIQPFREPGQFWPSHLSASERSEICDFVLRAVRSFDITVGALHVEVKVCEDGPHIIEINGRLGGFIPELLNAGAAVDMVALAAQAALGAQIPTVLDESQPSGPHRVRFQHSTLAPPGAVEFVAAPTASALGGLADVDFYRLLVSAGTELSRGVATQELDLLQAVADDHEAMLATLERLLPEIVLSLRFEDGTVSELTGLEISARNEAHGPAAPKAAAVPAKSLICWNESSPHDDAVVCIPWAGAGARPFRAWASTIDGTARLYGARLSGREARFNEPPPASIAGVAAELAQAIAQLREKRVHLVGHCSGAIIAFEVARALRMMDAPALGGLVVVNQVAPGLLADSLSEEDDPRRYIPEGASVDPELMDLLVAVMEADMQMIRRYEYVPGERLDIPITAIGGADGVTEDDLVRWADETTGGLVCRRIEDADHLFSGDAWTKLAEEVRLAVAKFGHPVGSEFSMRSADVG